MTYTPAAERYDRMTYRRCGRSGLLLPAMSLGLWWNFGGVDPFDTEPRDRPPRVRPRDHALRPGEQLRAAVRLCGGEVRAAASRGSRPVPRRARHLDEGRLRHVARPVRRVGLAQVPAREPRPEPRAHGPRLRRHLLLPPPRPRDAARGDDGCARLGGAGGEGALRRNLVVLRGSDARGGGDPPRSRDTAADPPAVVLDAEPLDRAGPARRPRRARSWLHRLLAARAGDAHGQVPQRDPRGLTCQPTELALAEPDLGDALLASAR